MTATTITIIILQDMALKDFQALFGILGFFIAVGGLLYTAGIIRAQISKNTDDIRDMKKEQETKKKETAGLEKSLVSIQEQLKHNNIEIVEMKRREEERAKEAQNERLFYRTKLTQIDQKLDLLNNYLNEH